MDTVPQWLCPPPLTLVLRHFLFRENWALSKSYERGVVRWVIGLIPLSTYFDLSSPPVPCQRQLGVEQIIWMQQCGWHYAQAWSFSPHTWISILCQFLFRGQCSLSYRLHPSHHSLGFQSPASLSSEATFCEVCNTFPTAEWGPRSLWLCLRHPQKEALLPRTLLLFSWKNTAKLKPVSKQTAFRWTERTPSIPIALFWHSNQQKYNG